MCASWLRPLPLPHPALARALQQQQLRSPSTRRSTRALTDGEPLPPPSTPGSGGGGRVQGPGLPAAPGERGSFPGPRPPRLLQPRGSPGVRDLLGLPGLLLGSGRNFLGFWCTPKHQLLSAPALKGRREGEAQGPGGQALPVLETGRTPASRPSAAGWLPGERGYHSPTTGAFAAELSPHTTSSTPPSQKWGSQPATASWGRWGHTPFSCHQRCKG